jgi:uncharacterized protein YyaL (SSP411 family)
MVLITLRAMALGGMRDHIGGGFHRYSVDAEWRVPHFEKMLYDQAQLVLAYVEAAQLTGDAFFADVAIDTLDYVRTDLRDEAGGFYSAEDADSVPPEQAGEPHPHKMEGAFYIWREDEIREVLGPMPRSSSPVTGSDPTATHPSIRKTSSSTRTCSIPLDRSRKLSPPRDVGGRGRGVIARSRKALGARRSSRPRPHLDDKVLTAWNGLMIAAFARAGRVLDQGARFLDDARRAAQFVREKLWDPASGRLLRALSQGRGRR